MTETNTKTSFQKIIAELIDGPPRISRRSLQEFSDITPDSLASLREAWPRIQLERKRILLDGLQSLSEEDTLVSFDDVARALLTDNDAQIRMRALRLLDECHDLKLVPLFINMLTGDEDAGTRGEAAVALAKFVELGELEEIPEKYKRQVEDALLAKANSEDTAVIRRNALEALGYSSQPEVVTLIESSFRRENPEWQASALFAMGRSFDERWEEYVLSRMLDENPIVRLAAVQAAGELRLASARTVLFHVLEDEEEDEITSAAIWSLSQVGGEDVRVYLEALLDQAEEDDDTEFLEEAIDNLEFTDELNHFDLMAVDPDEED